MGHDRQVDMNRNSTAPRPRWQFSLRTLFLLVTFCAIAMAFARVIGPTPVVRTSVTLAVIAGLVRQLWRPGQKDAAIAAISCIVVLHVLPFFLVHPGIPGNA